MPTAAAKRWALATPDQWGNYWLGPRKSGPAIFASRSKRWDGHEWVVKDNGSFILFLGVGKGFVFQGGCLKRFRNPATALAYLEEALSEEAKSALGK